MNAKLTLLSTEPVRHDSYLGDTPIRCSHSGLTKTVNEAAKLGWKRQVWVDTAASRQYIRFVSGLRPI